MSEISDILSENVKRNKALHNKGDQVTGHGVEAHDVKISIKGYPLSVQWITTETADTPIYRLAKRLKSVRRMADHLAYSENDVSEALMFERCRTDPWFAFATCFTIMHKTSGQKVPFLLNYAQHQLLSEFERMRRLGKPIRLILLKARQWGGSTLTQLYMAWIQLFIQRGWNSVIIAQTKDTARRIKAMYRTTLNSFPADLIGYDSLQFKPKEGSTADSFIASQDGDDIRDSTVTVASFENFEAARGAAFSMAHYSEVAYWTDTPSKTATEVITNVDGGISLLPLTLEVMESTANGMSGLFYDEYQKAKSGLSIYRPLFIPFYYIEHDTLPFESDQQRRLFAQRIYDERNNTSAASDTAEPGTFIWSLWEKGATLEHIHWYIEKRRGFHFHDQIASEAPSDDIECFRYSGANVFNQEVLVKMEQQDTADPIWKGDTTDSKLIPNEHGNLYIWRHPDRLDTTDQYIVTVDVGGRGEHADYSVISVFNRWPITYGGGLECVARWRGHLRYDLMAWKAVQIARHYKDALLVFESNTLDRKLADAREHIPEGEHIRGILAEIEGAYDNLYYRAATDPEDIRQGIVRKIGFHTNFKTKQDMVDVFTVALEDGHYRDHDRRFFREAMIYQQFPDGHYGNIPGNNNHDDILMTAMIASLISRDLPAPALRSKTKAPKQSLGTINESFI